ncbi:MAG TPA: UDP-N-acetylmuramoyl-L-alanyl-D-glutamate--2,6-diaminopimelate ligase, partial [Nitrospirae bacterium]|nr:UDP-N-acetylmuramoyl-L-alanyl-D-glutamate--2,6-diaminopimelate ligase [Nitrospirota bacterium]
FTRGRIITVFGCGGDRDRGKRPEMGRIASQLSDLVIVTSDNPRSERPEDIIAGILEGVRKDNCTVVTDRREAIFRAVDIARKDDTILVAGKGHEDYQEIEGVRYPFKDREVLKEALDGLSRLSG